MPRSNEKNINLVLIFILVLFVVVSLSTLFYYSTSKYGNETMSKIKRAYIGNSPEECSKIKFICLEGMRRFDDDRGCGCSSDMGRNYCTNKDKNLSVCVQIYDPVCGYADQGKTTYSNSCFACTSNSLYWVNGECERNN